MPKPISFAQPVTTANSDRFNSVAFPQVGSFAGSDKPFNRSRAMAPSRTPKRREAVSNPRQAPEAGLQTIQRMMLEVERPQSVW
jgi:hypothetical protein